jgi:hypothetical protein
MLDLPKNWRPGDDIRDNGHHDATVRAVRRLAGGDATGGPEQRSRFAPVLARVVLEGPKGEGDYTDARYWVKFAWATGSTDESEISFTDFADPEQGEPVAIVTATNISERRQDGVDTHRIPEGAAVWLIPLWDNSNPSNFQWVFVETWDDFVGYCEITASAQIGTNKQWTYTVKLKSKTGAGHAGWTDYITALTAYNAKEYGNGATGLMGNGVTLDGSGVVAGTDYTVSEIPTGKGLHRLYVTFYTTAGVQTGEYWFEATNPLTGDCTP